MSLPYRPTNSLSKEDWRQLEEKAARRAEEGDELNGEVCPICLDKFRIGAQVILSCSHVFHRACLTSFEKHQSRQGVEHKSCPVCRKSEYESQGTSHWEHRYRERCAVYLQARVRGWLTRGRFRRRLAEFFAQGGGDELRRRDFFAEELTHVGQRFLDAVCVEDDSLDALLAASDQALALSQQVFGAPNSLRESRLGSASASAPVRQDGHPHRQAGNDEAVPYASVDWETVRQQALLRCDEECAICMMELKPRCQVLLSCTHVFHASCISAFENFSFDQEDACPICRSRYAKHTLEA